MDSSLKITYLDSTRKAEIEAFLDEWFSDAKEFNARTSGSTGNPKLISINKEFAKNSARKTIQALNITKGSNSFLCLSTETIAGKMMVIRSILNEMNLLVGKVSSSSITELDLSCEFAALVPMQLDYALSESTEKLFQVNNILIGGAPLSNKLTEKLKEIKLSVYQSFGMTETISHFALRRVGFENDDYYTAIPGVSFSQTNTGNLIVNYPEIGIENLVTNDQIELISETQFKWLGRTDFVINSGGVKIHPELVEAKLENLIDRPFFISGRPDDILGEQVILIIEGKEDNEILLKLQASGLAKYEIPKKVFFVKSFVRAQGTKINRPSTVELIKDEY